MDVTKLHKTLIPIYEKMIESIEILDSEIVQAKSVPNSIQEDIDKLRSVVDQMNKELIDWSKSCLDLADIAYGNYENALKIIQDALDEHPLPEIPWIGRFDELASIATQLEAISPQRWEMIVKLAEIFKVKDHE